MLTQAVIPHIQVYDKQASVQTCNFQHAASSYLSMFKTEQFCSESTDFIEITTTGYVCKVNPCKSLERLK